LYGQEEVVEQVKGGLGGRGGAAVNHQELEIHCHEGCKEALANSDYNEGLVA
jgi:hypothetical protein